jgi:hypothetical protein
VREIYGIIENSTSIIVEELCLTTIKHFKPLVIPKLIKSKIKQITIGFESLHGIPYTIGAINGNSIPIITPKVDPKANYS